MISLKSHEIKREQKKSLFLREFTLILQSLAQDEPSVAKVYPTRVDFSADTGICYVYFATYTQDDPQTTFDEALKMLKLYKSSMRSAIAKRINGRYTPDLMFLFDEVQEKIRKMNSLLDTVQQELRHIKEEDHAENQ